MKDILISKYQFSYKDVSVFANLLKTLIKINLMPDCRKYRDYNGHAFTIRFEL